MIIRLEINWEPPISRLRIDSSRLLFHRAQNLAHQDRADAELTTDELIALMFSESPFRGAERRDPTPDVRLVRFHLDIDGELLELGLVDYLWDPSLAVFHLAAIVLEDAEDYARFTVSDTDSTLVGTVHRGEKIYRIIPAANRSEQLLYPILRRSGSEDAYGVSDRTGRVGVIEMRHVQTAKIADIQPDSFNMSSTSALASISGGDLGTLNVSSILAQSDEEDSAVDELQLADQIEAYYNSLRVLTRVSEDLTVEVYQVRPSGFIRFRQILDGIPVHSGGHIGFNPDTGKVRSLAGMMYPADSVEPPSPQWWCKDDAVALAIQAVSEATGIVGDPTVHEIELQYRRADGGPRPHWVTSISIRGERRQASYRVVVDAILGEAEAHNIAHNF